MAADARDVVDLSIVLPCFNEQDSVRPLLGEIVAVLDALPMSAEIVFVDDASTDGTVAVLEELRRGEPRLRIVRHTVNCGESAGQATGFRVSRGGIVVTMDSDGQNDPADIPRLLEALQGHDCACGVRRRRLDDWVKRISSKIGNGFRNVVTGDRVGDAGCTYRALRRAATRELPAFNGMHRFVPTLLRMQGFRVCEIDVNHRPRAAGVSKYGIGNRMWRGIADCLAMRWWRRRAFPGARTGPEAAAAPPPSPRGAPARPARAASERAAPERAGG